MSRPAAAERGAMTVEVAFLLVLLVVPLFYLVGTLGRLQAGAYAVTAAAREAGRAFVTADSAGEAPGRAQAAADLAAISGATALTSVYHPEDPCQVATRVARANGAELTGCQVDGEDVTVDVVVRIRILGVPRTAGARARAGPVEVDPLSRSG